MFDYIQGSLVEKKPAYVVIDTSGFGMHIQIPISSFDSARINENIKLFVHFRIVRNEFPTLYGFETTEQRSVFQSILAVSGVGPALAMNVLGSFSPTELAAIIAAKDAKLLTRVPKLGMKKAQLIILGLEGSLEGEAGTAKNIARIEAVEALISLGYKKKEAEDLINALKELEDYNQMSSSDLVKLALTKLNLSTN